MKRYLWIILLFLFISVTSGVTHTEGEKEYLYDKYEYTGPEFESDERIDKLVRYTYEHCTDILGEGDIIVNGINYSCYDQALTRTAENGARGRWVESPTSDFGICQLNYKYHHPFIDDKERFEDPINQIHYCMEVWQDAIRKGVMPWVAYQHRKRVEHLFK